MSEPTTIWTRLGAVSLRNNLVISTDGEAIGRVRDLFIDLEAGVVAFDVVSLQEAAKSEVPLFAIPHEDLAPFPTERRFVVDLDAPQLLGKITADGQCLLDVEGWVWLTNGCETFGLKSDRN